MTVGEHIGTIILCEDITPQEKLQVTVEQLETTTEALQSANEELETTNEEQQSTNEETGNSERGAAVHQRRARDHQRRAAIAERGTRKHQRGTRAPHARAQPTHRTLHRNAHPHAVAGHAGRPRRQDPALERGRPEAVRRGRHFGGWGEARSASY